MTCICKVISNMREDRVSSIFFMYSCVSSSDFRRVLFLWGLRQWWLHSCWRLQDRQHFRNCDPVPIWILCGKFCNCLFLVYTIGKSYSCCPNNVAHFYQIFNSRKRILSCTLIFLSIFCAFHQGRFWKLFIREGICMLTCTVFSLIRLTRWYLNILYSRLFT